MKKMNSKPVRIYNKSVAALCLCFTIASFASCQNEESRKRELALANDTTVLDSGAVREAIPAGIDPAMVEWRSDGKLIPSKDSLIKTPGYVVDSIFTPEEALRRFQEEAGPLQSPTLAGGRSSVDDLLKDYWQHLSEGDSLAITPLVISKPEFAWLYFPESNEPNIGLQPHVSWLLMSNNGGRGLARAIALAQANESEVRSTFCVDNKIEAGNNTIHGPCAIVRKPQSDTIWIAGHILERDGIFKLMSFSNDL